MVNNIINYKNHKIWFMRQAGRYLPEFRKVRNKNKNFINLCLNSKLSCDLSLQPIKRFDLDAAIIFSDILMVPYGLGQKVEFKKNKGPILGEININKILETKNSYFIYKLNPIYKAIKKLRKKLKKNKSLIAFVGAPWTILIYMLHKKSPTNNFNLEKILKNKTVVNLLLKKLNSVLCLHIENQIKAGADIIQIFDSWAGLLNKKNITNYCIKPNLRLVNHIKAKKAFSICFPKGINKSYEKFVKVVNPDCINIDSSINPKWAREKFRGICIQGGLDPMLLLGSEKKLIKKINYYLNVFENYPYIFNLGHGILPQTKPSTVSKIIKTVRGFKP